MAHKWLNNGEPLPAGHRKAGMFGLQLDIEDGRPEPQYVYAESREAMTDKLATMYGNTQARNAELKHAPRPTSPAAAAVASAPTTSPSRLSPDQRMQTVADLNDPARAGAAALTLIRDETGVDLREQAIMERKRNETQKFVDAHPDWYGTARNAALLRDRTFARVGTDFTANDLAQSFRDLQEMDALESAPSTHHQPAISAPEPSAPPAPEPRGSTGFRPTSIRGPQVAVTGRPRMTRSEALALAGTDEYVRRLSEEPGFAAAVDAAMA